MTGVNIILYSYLHFALPMKFKELICAIYLASIFFSHSVADEYFELFAGTNVWARTSFRIRRFVSVEDCARRCIQTYGCTSFVYSRGTRFCYGRKNVSNKHRRHWHRNRRYDFYNRLTGSDREQIENVIPDTGETQLIFVRRQQAFQSDPSFRAPAQVQLFSVLEDVNNFETRYVPTNRPIPTTTTRRIEPTTTTRQYRPRRPRPSIETTTTRRPRPTVARSRTRPTPRLRTRPTKVVIRTRPTTEYIRIPPTVTSRRRTYPTTTRQTTTTTERTPPDVRTPELICIDKPIGLEDGTFPMNRVSASSSYWRFKPSNSALNSGNGWMASTTNIGEYLEIDFGEPKTIVAVSTQGSTYFLLSEYVTRYKLKFSLSENGEFKTYEEHGQERTFDGNSDANTAVKNQLKNPVNAYKIQFHPIAFFNNIMMRVEVYEAC
ncbi:uncharacterized protein LOC120340538 [Styela clava]